MTVLKILFLLDAVFAALFSFFSVSFAFDVAAFAFPLACLFNLALFYFAARLLKNPSRAVFVVVKKMLQYQSFMHLLCFILRRAGLNGTARVYDAFCVVFWFLSFVVSLAILFLFSEKRIAFVNPEWKGFLGRQKRKAWSAAWFGFEFLDWVDALVQAVFMVLLFQIFFFQLYKIPSESMVPSLLVRDRLMVSKITSGPKFPLSDIGVPELKRYKRGDIVVFRNPHYESGRKDEVKSVVSELVYMLTFTLVNLNVDEYGMVKADPLVKRITGIPGEQLMMLDGVLYSRTKESPDFAPVKEDATWANYNLETLDNNLKNMIMDFPISKGEFEKMTAFEKERNSLDIEAARNECEDLARRFLAVSKYRALPPAAPDFITDRSLLLQCNPYAPNTRDFFNEYFFLTIRLSSSVEGAAWFNAFMTEWIASYDEKSRAGLFGGDLYSDANFRLNLMAKLFLGRFVVRTAELVQQGISSAEFAGDETLKECVQKAVAANVYAMYLDRRNMPVFPANNEDGAPNYIPDGCFFMMGDNRFNSQDMRHSYNDTIIPVCADDAYSVVYNSNIAPQFVGKNRILGTTVFRFWPFFRIGKV